MLPDAIFKHYDLIHIDQTFQELHDRFGFPIKPWKKRFKEYLYQQPRNTSELDAFVQFGNGFINPLLNNILTRPSGHSTFLKMLYYIIEKTVPTKTSYSKGWK